MNRYGNPPPSPDANAADPATGVKGPNGEMPAGDGKKPPALLPGPKGLAAPANPPANPDVNGETPNGLGTKGRNGGIHGPRPNIP